MFIFSRTHQCWILYLFIFCPSDWWKNYCLINSEIGNRISSSVNCLLSLNFSRKWINLSSSSGLREADSPSFCVSRFRRLPSSYTVELLTIHIWELAGKPLLFSLVQGMRAVLKLLVRYAEIDVVWHRHYHPKFPIFVKVNQKHTR